METNSLTHDFSPNVWNNNIHIKGSHNCYAYMLNDINSDLINIYENNYKNNNNSKNKYINPQPGHFCGMTKKVNKEADTTCDIIFQRVLCDNPSIKVFTDNKTILKHDARVMNTTDLNQIVYDNDTHYLGALSIDDKDKMYHFYRQDNNMLWSHKDGGKAATNLDNKGNLISDPKTADRGRYNTFCGYLLLPKNHVVKTNMARNNYSMDQLYYN